MEYKIRKSSYHCATCEREIKVAEPYCSVLRFEESEPLRTDYCEVCFERDQLEQVESAGADLAYWRARRGDGGETKKSIDFVTLRELLFRMLEHSSEEYRKICYLVGLVLIRKRLLKLDEFITEEGVDYLVVSTKLRPEPLRLHAPELQPSEFADLRDKLKQLLDIEFDEADMDGVATEAAAARIEEPED